MASSKEYLQFVIEQLSELDGITSRANVLYYHGRVYGGIYDCRFLVKPTMSAKQHRCSLEALYNDLPQPKKK